MCVLHKTLARMKPESHLPVFTRPKIMDGRNWLIQNVGIMLEDEGNDKGDKQDNDNDDDDNNNDNSDDNIDDDD